MNEKIKVFIHADELLKLLSQRLDFWIPQALNKDYKELFLKMYENHANGCIFEDCELDIDDIVDNDVINYCKVYSKDELSNDDWQKLSSLYKKGEWDISTLSFDLGSYGFLEAMNDNAVLLRS